MSDLFDWTPPPGYPLAPGYREHTTSRAAARKISSRAQTLRDQVMITLRTAWPAGMTADEVAAKMGKSVLSVRPRFSELRELGDVMPCQTDDKKPLRRPNASGADAIVWVCKRPEPTDGA